jgi:adenosylcobinamide-GDP ribazoletransferase
MKRLLLALSLLTSIPLRLKEAPEAGDTGRSAGWYPLVGVLIGGIAAGVYDAGLQIFPPLIAAVLSVVVWIGLTGGLHLDGVADCCDGMLHASTRERRLEIMKDPRLGTFGGIGLSLAILLKITCVVSLPIPLVWIALPLAAATGRWILLSAGKQKMARPGGMGADFALGLSQAAFIPASLMMVALLCLAGWIGLIAFLLSTGIAWLIIRLANSRLGGLTGDVFGLLVEASEIVVLLIFCLKI